MDPSPVVRLNRAIALRQVEGPEAALQEVETLSDRLSRYHLFHATRAEMLHDLGREEEAREATRQALTLTENPGERALLLSRLT
jgi:RNA polymerase sigma-70 factor (ECF subfamily)